MVLTWNLSTIQTDGGLADGTENKMITEDIRAIYQKFENIISFNVTISPKFPRIYFELL